jgi:predicted enzyme related to lactoylglutathione lyase
MHRQVGALILFVNDLEKMKFFFKDILGLELFGSRPDWAGFKAGELLIELFGPEHRGPDVGVSIVPGVKDFDAQPLRISFKTDDLETEVAGLKRKGARLLGPIGQESWGKYAWLADPEGNQHQLWEPAENRA